MSAQNGKDSKKDCSCTPNLVSYEEFVSAVTSNGTKKDGKVRLFPKPTKLQYDEFIRSISAVGKIADRREAAMFLAQVLCESDGLKLKEEDYCIDNPSACVGYNAGESCALPGKWYHGRGYLQLTWCANYLKASRDLGLEDTLRKNPQLVLREDLAWDTAAWFWKRYVKPKLNSSEAFDLSSQVISPSFLGCSGESNTDHKMRFKIYENVFNAWKIPGEPKRT